MADQPGKSNQAKTGRPIVGARVACAKCHRKSPFVDIRSSDHGTVWVYSIVHRSAPGIPTPYVAAIVDLPEGVRGSKRRLPGTCSPSAPDIGELERH
jgi:uncharacterized OB-fold protein